MSGRKPVLVCVMYSARACLGWDLVHSLTSCPREETSGSRRFLATDRGGQVMMACWKDSGSIRHRGQVVSGFLANPEGWAASSLYAACIRWILPAPKFPKPMKRCGEREGGYS